MSLNLEEIETNSEKFLALINYIDQCAGGSQLKAVHWALHQAIDLFISVSGEPELSANMAKFLRTQEGIGNFSWAHVQKMLNIELAGTIAADEKLELLSSHIDAAVENCQQYALDKLISALIGLYAAERATEKPDDRTLARIELLLKKQNDCATLNDLNRMKMVSKRIPFGMPSKISFKKRLALEIISDDGRQVILRMEEGAQPITLYHPPDDIGKLRKAAEARRRANQAARNQECQARRVTTPKKATA